VADAWQSSWPVAAGFYFVNKLQRLKRSSLFHRVRLEGKSEGNSWLGLQVAMNGLPYNRWGFAVGRRIGCAVNRNRVKRRLREIIRLRDGELEAGWDGVVVARSRATLASYQDLEKAFRQLVTRCGLSVKEPSDNSRAGG
jgi:ribonuclease P protein component